MGPPGYERVSGCDKTDVQYIYIYIDQSRYLRLREKYLRHLVMQGYLRSRQVHHPHLLGLVPHQQLLEDML